jgi:DNA-binding response OmpR family regulator
MKLLIAEDERDLNQLLYRKLSSEGYTVDAVRNGEDAWNLLICEHYDLVLLDVMMPRMNGFDLLQKMRENGYQIPVLLLTARDGIEDRVTGLELGADDYLLKPFSMDELLARIHAVLRRSTGLAPDILKIGDLTLDIEQKKVIRAGKEIELSSKEFSVLLCLIESCGKVLSREQILDRAWNQNYVGESNIVDVYIRYLREKIDRPFEKKLIYTIRGVGYAIRNPEEEQDS